MNTNIVCFVDLDKNRECMEFKIEDTNYSIKIAGTISDPYFCGNDLCNVLMYTKPIEAIRKHVYKEDKKTLLQLRKDFENSEDVVLGPVSQSLSYNDGKAVYINETGLYTLLIKSKAPFAVSFQRYVCKEILPAIRKYGSFDLKEKETLEKQLREKDEQLEYSNNHILFLKEMLVDDTKISKTQIVYIATSRNYARQNRFKVGGVESHDKLASRLSTYNCRSAVGDEWNYTDVFNVAEYKQIELRLKYLIGRFRDKKSKEIYNMHYTNLRYIVEYLCSHYSDEVDEVNERLKEFISNLNIRNLRPVVPEFINNFASITNVENGVATNTLVHARSREEFADKLKEYVEKLDPDIKSITRKQVFDDMRVSKNRNALFDLLVNVVKEIRPDLVLKSR